MAQGDAINKNGTNWGGAGTTLELQPSSGVEWCITTWWSGSNMEVQHNVVVVLIGGLLATHLLIECRQYRAGQGL